MVISNPINCRLMLRLVKKYTLISVSHFVVKFDDDEVFNQKRHLSFLIDEIQHFTLCSIKLTITTPTTQPDSEVLAPLNQKTLSTNLWTKLIMRSENIEPIPKLVIWANVRSARQNQWPFRPSLSLTPLWIIKKRRKKSSKNVYTSTHLMLPRSNFLTLSNVNFLMCRFVLSRVVVILFAWVFFLNVVGTDGCVNVTLKWKHSFYDLLLTSLSRCFSHYQINVRVLRR